MEELMASKEKVVVVYFKKIKEKIGRINGVEGEGRRCIFFVKNKVSYKCKSFFSLAARSKKDATWRMKRENVRNVRMVEKDVMESCLQRLDDSKGCNGE